MIKNVHEKKILSIINRLKNDNRHFLLGFIASRFYIQVVDLTKPHAGSYAVKNVHVYLNYSSLCEFE